MRWPVGRSDFDPKETDYVANRDLLFNGTKFARGDSFDQSKENATPRQIRCFYVQKILDTRVDAESLIGAALFTGRDPAERRDPKRVKVSKKPKTVTAMNTF